MNTGSWKRVAAAYCIQPWAEYSIAATLTALSSYTHPPPQLVTAAKLLALRVTNLVVWWVENSGSGGEPGGHLSTILRIVEQGPPILTAAPQDLPPPYLFDPRGRISIRRQIVFYWAQGPNKILAGPSSMGGPKLLSPMATSVNRRLTQVLGPPHTRWGVECRPLCRHKCRHIGRHDSFRRINCPRGN